MYLPLLAPPVAAALAALLSAPGVRVAPPTIVEYVIPRPDNFPHDPAVAADGSVWYTDQRNSYIGRLDPETGKIVDYPTPTPGSGPHGLIVGARRERLVYRPGCRRDRPGGSPERPHHRVPAARQRAQSAHADLSSRTGSGSPTRTTTPTATSTRRPARPPSIPRRRRTRCRTASFRPGTGRSGSRCWAPTSSGAWIRPPAR